MAQITVPGGAKILAVLDRRPKESVEAFKERCGRACMQTYPDETRDMVAVGRFAAIGEGRFDMRNNYLWGQVFPDLPAETCYIIGYTARERRNHVLMAS